MILLQAALAGSAVAAPKILSRDGSLVIENPDGFWELRADSF